MDSLSASVKNAIAEAEVIVKDFEEKVDAPIVTIDSITHFDADYQMPQEKVFESHNSLENKGNNFNIFQMLDLFSKEGFLSKEDRKTLGKFERDLNLEAKLMDNNSSYDDLTPTEMLKMSEYFSLISKLTPNLEKSNPKKINSLIKKYSEDNGKSKPFKKKRFRDVRKQIL